MVNRAYTCVNRIADARRGLWQSREAPAGGDMRDSAVGAQVTREHAVGLYRTRGGVYEQLKCATYVSPKLRICNRLVACLWVLVVVKRR